LHFASLGVSRQLVARAFAHMREKKRIKRTYKAPTIGLHLNVVVRIRPFSSLGIVSEVSLWLT
jgi:hypothetical protein